MTALSTPSYFKGLDHELFPDYLGELADLAPSIERLVGHLRAAPDEPNHLTALFRAFHNLKGGAALCRFELGVQIAHHIESALMRVRAGELEFTPLLAEAILLALDRLELTAEAAFQNKTVTHLRLTRLQGGLEGISKARRETLDSLCARMIENVSGFRPSLLAAEGDDLGMRLLAQPVNPSSDMEFFQSLALQLEHRSPLFLGRTARLQILAHGMNRQAGMSVDARQLEAALYLHDLGMMFLPESIWLQPGQLSDDARDELHHHPEFGAGLIARMPGWGEAGRMVAQHHEKPDGSGYPAGLKGDAICPGAKIIAIVDAFESVMLKHRHRGQQLSTLRAAAEINACEDQFAAEWIGPFNIVARQQLRD